MAEKKSYRVYYEAKDGHKCTFIFKSDRSFRRYQNNNYFGKTFGTPFMEDMFKQIERYEKDPNNPYIIFSLIVVLNNDGSC